ncbi:hypothetical protein ACFQZT_12765 [Paenibacillus sp. GCM10027628]|uniref:hypothetical protein n=1 Tax=Paenibacillus sp. GCM10027628 TaxID=3273413 RepID=UPI00362782A5
MIDVAKQIIKLRASLHMNDPKIEEYRQELITVLSEDSKKTIDFLMSCTKDEILYSSEVFEEVAYNLQSVEYLKCLRFIDKQNPELNLTRCVEVAESYMN